MLGKILPACWSVSDTPFHDCFGLNCAIMEIFFYVFSFEELRFKELRRFLAGISKPLVFFFFLGSARGIFRQLHPSFFRELLQSSLKIYTFHFLHEREDVAFLTAAKAHVCATLGRNHKRRRALFVERTPRAHVAPRFLELHVLPHHLSNGETIFDQFCGRVHRCL